MVGDPIRIIFLCSGQGSQFYGMGRQFYEGDTIFCYWMNHLDEIVKEYTGISIVSHIYGKSKSLMDPMDRLLISHPAIFMVEYAMAKSLENQGIQPDIVLGTSLGEFTCFALAGILSVTETLKLIVAQAEIVESHCKNGAMLAVMHSPQLYLSEPELHQKSDLAAINFDTHFVVAGVDSDLKNINNILSRRNILTQVINVKQAFHSRYIDIAGYEYMKHLKKEKYADPMCSVFSCSTNGFLESPSLTHLWDCVRRPILFQHGIRRLESFGSSYNYIDIGPSGTLATFVKYNLTKDSLSKVFPIMTMQGRCKDNLDKLLEIPHIRT